MTTKSLTEPDIVKVVEHINSALSDTFPDVPGFDAILATLQAYIRRYVLDFIRDERG